MIAMVPATAKLPAIKYDIKNVAPLPVSLQLIVFTKLRLLLSLKAHTLSDSGS